MAGQQPKAGQRQPMGRPGFRFADLEREARGPQGGHENPEIQNESRSSRKVHGRFTEGSRKGTMDLCATAGSGAVSNLFF